MKQVAASFLACFVLLAPLVWAAPLEVAIDPATTTANPGETAIYTLTVFNNMSFDDSFLISIDGSRIEWKFPGNILLDVLAGESRETEIMFNPSAEEGPHTFTATVSSFSHPSIFTSVSFVLDVEIPPQLSIKGIKLEQDGNGLQAVVELDARTPTDTNIMFSLKDISGKTLNSLTTSGRADGISTFSKTFSLEGLEPGGYAMSVEVNGLKENKTFSLGMIHDMVQTVERSTGMFVEEITVTVVNRGNVAEDSYTVTQFIPDGDFITGFLTGEPSGCSTTDGGRSCSFTIPRLEPGKEAIVMYRMEFWPSYAKIVGSVLILAVFGLFYLVRISKPRIRKVMISKGGGHHHIILEVRGPFFRGIKDVIVKDCVFPLAQVLSNEFKHAVPVTARSNTGTELIWKLGRLGAKEERILSYKVKALVEGHLKMPKASLRFRDNKGGRVRVHSKPVIVRDAF